MVVTTVAVVAMSLVRGAGCHCWSRAPYAFRWAAEAGGKLRPTLKKIDIDGVSCL